MPVFKNHSFLIVEIGTLSDSQPGIEDHIDLLRKMVHTRKILIGKKKSQNNSAL